MSDLRGVPKPEGFDLRVARSHKNDTCEWLPGDSLYSASEKMKAAPPERAFLVAWYAKGEDGKIHLQWQGYEQHDCQLKALAAEMFCWLNAP